MRAASAGRAKRRRSMVFGEWGAHARRFVRRQPRWPRGRETRHPAIHGGRGRSTTPSVQTLLQCPRCPGRGCVVALLAPSVATRRAWRGPRHSDEKNSIPSRIPNKHFWILRSDRHRHAPSASATVCPCSGYGHLAEGELLGLRLRSGGATRQTQAARRRPRTKPAGMASRPTGPGFLPSARPALHAPKHTHPLDPELAAAVVGQRDVVLLPQAQVGHEEVRHVQPVLPRG